MKKNKEKKEKKAKKEKKEKIANIIQISPDDCVLWAFKDRSPSELGHISDLAADIKQNGQLQPGIVRLNANNTDIKSKYELIVGERRWRACKLAHLPFLVILKDLSDTEAAIYQVAENDQRKNLSDYSKGINYAKLINAGVLSTKDLTQKLRKSQQYISGLLSFSKISCNLIARIGDMTKISARTASEIVRWQEKGKQYQDVLLELAPKLVTGEIGANKLQKLILDHLNSEKYIKIINEVKSFDGRHLFTWKRDNNGQRTIGFPKDIRETLNFSVLEKNLIEHILAQLKAKDRIDSDEI